MALPLDQLAFLEDLHQRAMTASSVHFYFARRYAARNKILALSEMFLGTTIFVFLAIIRFYDVLIDKEISYLYVIFSSVLITVLSSMQAFSDFPALAERHRTAAARYATLRRKIEYMRLQFDQLGPEISDELRSTADELLSIDIEAPPINRGSFYHARNIMDETGPRERASAELGKLLQKDDTRGS